MGGVDATTTHSGAIPALVESKPGSSFCFDAFFIAPTGIHFTENARGSAWPVEPS
jgi:hypothetical protein